MCFNGCFLDFFTYCFFNALPGIFCYEELYKRLIYSIYLMIENLLTIPLVKYRYTNRCTNFLCILCAPFSTKIITYA